MFASDTGNREFMSERPLLTGERNEMRSKKAKKKAHRNIFFLGNEIFLYSCHQVANLFRITVFNQQIKIRDVLIQHRSASGWKGRLDNKSCQEYLAPYFAVFK